MTDEMRRFRAMFIEGPTLPNGKPLWGAQVDLGFPKTDFIQPPHISNFSLRVLAHEADAHDAKIGAKAIDFHTPLHESAAVTPETLLTVLDIDRTDVTILGERSFPVVTKDGPASPYYAELRLSPREPGTWPIRGNFEETEFPSAPPQRVTRGVVSVAFESSADLNKLFAIDWRADAENKALIFGGLEIEKHLVAGDRRQRRRAIRVDLTPQGIELDVWIPDPFSHDFTKLGLRVRLTPTDPQADSPLRLDLVGAIPQESSSLERLAKGFAWMSRDLAERDGALSLQIATAAVPPVSWVVRQINGGLRCCDPGEVPEVRVSLGSAAARILTREDFSGGELAVAQLLRAQVNLQKRSAAGALKLLIASRLDQTDVSGGPEITLKWNDAGEGSGSSNRRPDSAAVTAFKGTVETESLTARLTEVWRKSGAVAASADAPYAFLALERGWVQLPLPPALTVKPRAIPSTFDGFLRLDLGSTSANAAAGSVAGIGLTAAHTVRITIEWKKALEKSARAMEISLTGTAGTLEGVLWAGEASPTPTEILPPLDAGPAALVGVPIGFGRGVRRGWAANVQRIQDAILARIDLPLPVLPPDGDGNVSALVTWTAHQTLALVSAAAMTRTAVNALRPSATRKLVPTEIRGKSGQTLGLTFAANARLPSVEIPDGSLSRGSTWNWPWPSIRAGAGGESKASPAEQAGVSLVSLTLPGVEFTPEEGAATAVSQLRFSLRYDLPVLDELFGNTTAPQPKTAPADAASVTRELPPTSLDPQRLSIKWRENARKLAKARTHADRVVCDESHDPPTLWHSVTGAVKPRIRGLVEPYVWEPEGFKFELAPAAGSIHLGSYLLGIESYWGPRALAGFGADFKIGPNKETLVRIAGGDLETERFAVEGFATSSMQINVNNRPHLHDARNLMLALQADDVNGALPRRAVFSRNDPFGITTLASLTAPCIVKFGLADVKFWCRDLPMRAAGALFVFDPAGTPEVSSVPVGAISGAGIARALYEWRLYEPAVRGRFELTFGGPFSLRPLRLTGVELDAAGELKQLRLVGSVQLAMPEQTAGDQAPFEADRSYASGNLVELQFARSGGEVKLQAIRRVSFRGTAANPFPDAGSPTIDFTADATVAEAGGAIAAAPATRITLSLQLDVVNAMPHIKAASVRTKLFGQNCTLATSNVELANGPLQLNFQTSSHAPSDLQLCKISFCWPRAGASQTSPTLQLVDGVLTAAVRKGADAPAAFTVRFGSQEWLTWLGVSLSQQSHRIDHGLGTMTITIDEPLTKSTSLFRGFWLPPGKLSGTLAVVFAPSSAEWPTPTVATLYAEVAFTANEAGTCQRVTAIRHRHFYTGVQHEIPSAWDSRMFVDAQFESTTERSLSSIEWPIGRMEIDGDDPANQPPFRAHPKNKAQWVKGMMLKDSGMVLIHRVLPRLCAHQFPLDDLDVEPSNDHSVEIVLKKPWRMRAVVEHAMRPKQATDCWPGVDAGKPYARAELTWTSLEELSLFDMQIVAVKAAEDRDLPAHRVRLAFLARYPAKQDPDVVVPGVARRTVANAGFPMRGLLQVFQKNDQPPKSLVLVGACVTEVTVRDTAGVTMVPQWILPWAVQSDSTADIKDSLFRLKHVPQCDDHPLRFEIAAYDAAAGHPASLVGTSALALGAQDGTEALVDGRLRAMVGELSFTAASDQSFSKALDKPTNSLTRPLFLRTLIALNTVAHAFGQHLKKENSSPALFSQKVLSVVARQQKPRGAEYRLQVNAWPRDIEAPKGTAPGVTLIAMDERAIATERLPASLAASLVDPASDALALDGGRRADAAMRALGLLASPRIVLLARVDDTYLAIRSSQATGGPQNIGGAQQVARLAIGTAADPPPHVSWMASEIAAPLLGERTVAPLRMRDDTVHASPTLGWPEEPYAVLAQLQPHLGDEKVSRSEEDAWAGRSRSVAWPARAWGVRDKAQEMVQAPFIMSGQRVAFRTRADGDMRMPSDRFAVLTPPRARVPTVDSLLDAFENVREKEDAQHLRARLAPMLPARMEVTVTGQRPGVLVTQHESVLWSASTSPFDPQLRRFGRPGSRGPVIARNVRAPRSSVFPQVADLSLRRRTFVAQDEGPSEDQLNAFKLLSGPANIVRLYSRDGGKVSSVTLTIASPVEGHLSADWDGRFRLIARAPGGDTATSRLARIGLLPPPQDGRGYKLRSELQVGDVIVSFDTMTWTPGGDASTLYIDFLQKKPIEAPSQQVVASALREATADTPVRVTIRCLPDKDADCESSGELQLGIGTENEQLPGPPSRVLVFDLPHLPMNRRWLPVRTFTLAFGDPAYDRELGSPTKVSAVVELDVVPHLVPHYLGTDRAEYDTGATLHFAIWKQEKAAREPSAPGGEWNLALQLIPAQGGNVVDVAIRGLHALDANGPPRYLIKPELDANAFAIALTSLSPPPAPGDRLLVSARRRDDEETQRLVVDVGLVAEPVLPPPAAVYGLVTLRPDSGVDSTLFATAPLPQTIEFPNLVRDLMAGHVRRRALFLWTFATPTPPAAGARFASLVKFDRTGGGQLPADLTDFSSVDS